MNSNAIIDCHNISKSYQKGPEAPLVLRNVSFQVFPREVIGLIGPSGSGKSTLLRTLNALEPIQSGTIRVCGLDYENLGRKIYLARRKTAMIFQRFELFPNKTAIENITLPLRAVLKLNPRDALEKAESLLSRVGLLEHRKKFPRQLSGGQCQRVAIARALAMSPEVLLCDEPTSALDPELVHEVTDILGEIASQGMTLMIATHELSFIKKVAHRTFFMDQGEILENEKTSDLFSTPKSDRLKAFLSKVN